MKRISFILTVFVLIFSLTSVVHADGPMDKLKRGALNVVVSPLEIPNAMWDDWQTGTVTGYLGGATWGVVYGAIKFTTRALAGLYEVVTFPVPVPKDYWPVIEDPEFFQ